MTTNKKIAGGQKILGERRKGFTTIELLMYAAGMVVILSVIFYMIANMYNFYRRLTIEPRVDRVGTILLDRLTKDIRSGDSINMSESQFGINTGNITLNSKSGTTDVIKKFNYDEGRVTYQENSGSANYLTPSDISVSRFNFEYLTTAISEGIRVELDITYNLEGDAKTKSFVGFAILRNSYE